MHRSGGSAVSTFRNFARRHSMNDSYPGFFEAPTPAEYRAFIESLDEYRTSLSERYGFAKSDLCSNLKVLSARFTRNFSLGSIVKMSQRFGRFAGSLMTATQQKKASLESRIQFVSSFGEFHLRSNGTSNITMKLSRGFGNTKTIHGKQSRTCNGWRTRLEFISYPLLNTRPHSHLKGRATQTSWLLEKCPCHKITSMLAM